MKYIITLLLITSYLYGFSQISKTVNIGRTQNSSISVHIRYNGSTPIDTNYLFLGQDYRYQTLIEYIVLKSGSIQDIYKLLKAIKEFHETQSDDGTSLKYEENYISIYKFMGGKWLNVYGVGLDSNGYACFNIEQIKKLIILIENWAKKSHIQLS